MIISHPAFKEYQGKPLTQHLEAVAQGSLARIQRLSLATLTIGKDDLSFIAYRCGLLHDIGKASSYFQAHIRGAKSSILSRHSLISAIVLYHDIISRPKIKNFAPLAFKAVQRHHGNLSTFGSENLRDGVLIQNTIQIAQDIMRQIDSDEDLHSFVDKHKITIPILDQNSMIRLSYVLEDMDIVENPDDAIERFLLQNLLFSVLIDADKHDAAHLELYPDQALNNPISFSPQNYIASKEYAENELNSIRSKLLQEASAANLSPTKCYAMTAPTGSGKTLACMGFTDALQTSVQKQRRVIYCLPYTSIIDQNHEEIMHVLLANGIDATDPEILLKHHHLVDFSRKNQDENYDYHDYITDNLLADSWHAACVVSTFVQLFHSLIGSRNSLVRKLHNIINSIILLDEVQSLPPKYYPLLRQIFAVLAQRFDTPILTCTATQPFIFKPDSYLEISPSNIFDHPVFNRVCLQISAQSSTLEDFAQNLDLEDAHNALFVMNTKRCAIDLYNMLKERYQDSYQLFCLTTYHTPKCRLDIINKIKEVLEAGERIILVSTQLIEAGVDLSFQKVYRDMGPLDSVIQVAGRCNRHSEYGVLGGKMQLLNLEKDGKEYCSKVYDHYLLQRTKEILKGKSTLESRNFPQLISAYYQSLEFSAEASALLNAIKELNYDTDYQNQIPIDKFRLIEDQYASISLYLLLDQVAQDAWDRLTEAQEKLNSKFFADPQQESNARLIIKQSYHILAAYQINLNPSDLYHYNVGMSYFHKFPDVDHVYFIPFSDVYNAYDLDTGFILEPTYLGSALSL